MIRITESVTVVAFLEDTTLVFTHVSLLTVCVSVFFHKITREDFDVGT